MSKKLVFMSGKAYWLMPEGAFLPAERENGRIIDPVLFRRSSDQWSEELYGQ
ncbi:MAG: hypothetical protein BWY99_01128 [Synergistetes bacterium ADurb.BinA166]|jgi:hypothetical protein|nr:MAG: hypothetical protein BWY99_01128 [Synergistetes bacterium ADurb.BinA166]